MRRVALRQARIGGKHAWGECAGRYPHHGQSSRRCANERRREKAPRAAPAPRRDIPTPRSAFKPDWRSDPSSYWRPGGCPRTTSSLRGSENRDSQRRTRASHGGGGAGRLGTYSSSRIRSIARSRVLGHGAPPRTVALGARGRVGGAGFEYSRQRGGGIIHVFFGVYARYETKYRIILARGLSVARI